MVTESQETDLQSLQETDLQSLEEDIMSFEDNISQIRLLLLFIDNETLINSIETKINIKNKQMSNNELIKHIQSIKELKDYKVRYLLNFAIEKSQEELNQEELANAISANAISANAISANAISANAISANAISANEPYKLTTITNIKTFHFEERKYSKKVYFTALNTLIIIANKNNKYYIKRRTNVDKKNTSKKNIKS
jgi:glutamate synthase domain-containing protein 2